MPLQRARLHLARTAQLSWFVSSLLLRDVHLPSVFISFQARRVISAACIRLHHSVVMMCFLVNFGRWPEGSIAKDRRRQQWPCCRSKSKGQARGVASQPSCRRRQRQRAAC